MEGEGKEPQNISKRVNFFKGFFSYVDEVTTSHECHMKTQLVTNLPLLSPSPSPCPSPTFQFAETAFGVGNRRGRHPFLLDEES